MGRVISAFKQYLDSAGDPLRNGWLKFLEPETNNTYKDTYADNPQQIANENPFQLDGDGRCGSVFGNGDYRVISFTNDPELEEPGEQIQMFDPVTAQGSAAGGGGGSFGAWESDVEYNRGDIVTYNNKYYRSLTDGNENNNPSIEAAAWEEIEFVNYWNENITYTIGDFVRDDDRFYVSKIGSNINNIPSESLSSWTSLSETIIGSTVKTDDYEILSSDAFYLVILGSATAAAKEFLLPYMGATTSGFRLAIYNASDYNLTVTPQGTASLWIASAGIVIDKGSFLNLYYNNDTDTWLPFGNVGPVLGGQDIGSSSIHVNNLWVDEVNEKWQFSGDRFLPTAGNSNPQIGDLGTNLGIADLILNNGGSIYFDVDANYGRIHTDDGINFLTIENQFVKIDAIGDVDINTGYAATQERQAWRFHSDGALTPYFKNSGALDSFSSIGYPTNGTDTRIDGVYMNTQSIMAWGNWNVDYVVFGWDSTGLVLYETGVTSIDLYLGKAANLWDEIRMYATDIYMPEIYNNAVAGINLQIASNGQLGSTTSLARHKSNVETLTGLEWFFDLRPVSFNWKKQPDLGRQFGMIAEEVEPIAPELVFHNTDGDLQGIEYSRLIPIMAKIIQDQEARIQKLERNQK